MAPGSWPSSAVVVGGAGAVGAMIRAFFRNAGIDVVVVDRVAPDASTDGSDYSPGAYVSGDITAPDTALDTLLREADFVVLAVPEEVALAALPHLAELLAPDSVLLDTLSVKSRFGESVRGSALECAAVGVNPMFAPSLDPTGRPVAAVVYVPGPGVEAVLDTVTAAGASLVRLDADRHDRLTALTQALTHASILSFGLALAESGLSASELVAVGTPPHMLSLALLSRVSGGTPEVYWDVQAGNPYAEQARRTLVDAAGRVNDVVTGGDDVGFAQIVQRVESALGTEADALRATCAEVFTRLGRSERQ